MFTRSLRKSFGYRIFRNLAISIALILTVFTLTVVYFKGRDMKASLVREGRMLAELAAHNSRTGVFAENIDMLADNSKGLLQRDNVSAISFWTADRRIMLCQSKSINGIKPYQKTCSEDYLAFREDTGLLLEVVENKDVIGVQTPVVLKQFSDEEMLYSGETELPATEKTIGYVKVILDKKNLNRELTWIILRHAAVFLLLLISSFLISYMTIRRATKPLQELAIAARKFGEGKGAEKISITSVTDDEIGALTGSFNKMTEDIIKRDEEKKILEERLLHSRRIEAIGNFARDVAHDFSNILTRVQGAVYILDKSLHEKKELAQYFDQIYSSTQKARDLVKGLLSYSRLPSAAIEPMDINLIITKNRPAFMSVLGNTARLGIRVSEDPLMVMSNRIIMEQVFMNLCTNAKDAMPDGGSFEIKTAKVNIHEIQAIQKDYHKKTLMDAKYTAQASDENFVEIIVSDTGTGMDEETKERLFEPFYTTKNTDSGTGLGLAIVYGAIRKYNGYIDVESEKGKGTTFKIYIPLLESGDQNKAPEEGSSPGFPGPKSF